MICELIYLEPSLIDYFIANCALGNGCIIVRNNGDYVRIYNGRYTLFKDGRIVYQTVPREKAQKIIRKMIDKYQRFEYEGFYYHSPEMNVWTKQEI